jgi:type IV pilus assembly protein PilC
MVPLCRQLATSYDAGLPILKGLQLLERNASSTASRAVLLEMRSSIQAGATLADAARAQQHRLPPFFVELLASGESGGKLDVMLRDLADYYEDRLRINRAITGAMAYPLFILAATWFIGSFSLGIIGNLSFEAREPFNLGAYFQTWLAFQGGALLVAAVALAVLWALGRTGLPQRLLGIVGTHLWPFNNITRKFALSRFFRTFSLLVGAGVNIKHAIYHAASTASNPYVRDDLLKAIPIVAQGHTLQEAFAHCRTLTPVCREMLAVGEETGNLEFQLRKVSGYHLEEAQMATKVALRALGILMVLIAGGTVGYVIISFYSKLFSLYDSI